MLDRILEFEQALWLAAFAFYVFDVARLIAPGRLLLREAGFIRLRPVLAAFPFEFGGRELVFTGLLQPWGAVFMSRYRGDAPADALPLERADALRRSLTLLRLVSCLNFMLLFIAAPVLTALFGLGFALLIAASLVYGINFAIGVYLMLARERFQLRPGQAASLLIDTFLCAPYGANWTQRVARLQPELAPDFAQLRERFAPADFERASTVIALREHPATTE